MKEFICPWELIYDTREATPWLFEDIIVGTGDQKKQLVLNKNRGHLKSGDYSIVGMADQIAVERKSKADLYGTIGAGRDRFVRELGRLNAMKFAAVIIEAEWLDCISKPPERAKMTPASVNGSIIAWQQRFTRIHWWWLPGRYVASKQCWKILNRFFEDNK